MKRRLFSSPSFLLMLALGLLGLFSQSMASEPASADVVVIVDTSTSMKMPGMDPERASLLVTKLLADIVPGELAVVRLLGIGPDKALLPSRPTRQTGSCPENPQLQCTLVEATSDWKADARKNRYGVLSRPRRGDADFKVRLESHLEQRIGNSMFDLAFEAALGVYDGHPSKTGPRLVIWLSDGNSDHEEPLKQAIAETKAAGIDVQAIVFGAGDTRLPLEVGVETVKVGNPADMMNAFANSFRRIVQAPYRIDHRLDAAPSFDMKRNIQEAWVVVYGDKRLGEVEIQGPGQIVKADFAADVWPSAGAYKVVYLQNPTPGTWTVKAQGGGAGVAYAVVQRSELRPVLLAPEKARVGTPTVLVAGVVSGQAREPLADPEVLQDARIKLIVEGREISLHDDGKDGDAQANDGRFSGSYQFPKPGLVPLRLDLQSALVSRSEEASIQVGVGLSFWELWGWLVWLILGILVLVFILLGFILPQRFRAALAVVFVPDREDLDEQSPQPVKQWSGVGIGFYRNARAYLHPDYRLSGKSRGALAGLLAERGGNRVVPGNGVSLYRENLDGDYDAVPPQGVRCRAGDVFRVGGSGPYFRIASRG